MVKRERFLARDGTLAWVSLYTADGIIMAWTRRFGGFVDNTLLAYNLSLVGETGLGARLRMEYRLHREE